ncbi:hypothetical protein AGIG_G25313 [Arapaima gigas]
MYGGSSGNSGEVYENTVPDPQGIGAQPAALSNLQQPSSTFLPDGSFQIFSKGVLIRLKTSVAASRAAALNVELNLEMFPSTVELILHKWPFGLKPAAWERLGGFGRMREAGTTLQPKSSAICRLTT